MNVEVNVRSITCYHIRTHYFDSGSTNLSSYFLMPTDKRRRSNYWILSFKPGTRSNPYSSVLGSSMLPQDHRLFLTWSILWIWLLPGEVHLISGTGQDNVSGIDYLFTVTTHSDGFFLILLYTITSYILCCRIFISSCLA